MTPPPPPLFPTDTNVLVGYCDRCGDLVYQDHPHKRHRICAVCGEPCAYYGPFATTNGRDYTCEDCTDWTTPAGGEEGGYELA